MTEKAKFSRRVFTKEGVYEFGKRKTQDRDFGATRMTLSQLEKGAKRALRRASRTEAPKSEMYKAQAEAYQKRIAWYQD